MADKLDAGLLANARRDIKWDIDKLKRYDLWPVSDIKDGDLAKAAKVRSKEYGKEPKQYLKELEILVNRYKNHSLKEVAKIYYKKYEDYDLAVAAADADDPYEALLEDLDLEV